MAVSQQKFVQITSGVGAGTTVAERQLIGRLFTDNPLLPPQSYKEFASASDVGAYFGLSSPEYLRAQYYFDWVSKNITQAQLLSFARWVDSAQAGIIYGAQRAYILATLQAVTNGSLNLTIGNTQFTLTAINLAGDANLAAVAATVQAAIQAHTAGGTDWTAATVAYVASPIQGGQPQFVLTGGVIGHEAIGIAAANSGVDLGPILGWLDATAIVGQGSAIETITQTLETSAALSNNFGSFAFIPALNTTQITQAAQWNDGQNVLYQFMVPVTAANAVAIQAAIEAYAGCAITLSPLSNDYPELIPMTVLAATNYNNANAVQNFMYQTGFPSQPAVTNDTDYDTYTGLGINFYLVTQNAGKFINFYATGVLTGTATDPVDQNTYANEQWLKSDLAAELMTLFLDQPQIPPDNQGISLLSTILQATVKQAILNGTIVKGKPLTVNQKLFITTVTGQPNTWLQVQNDGYWLNIVIVPVTVDNVTKYKAVYTLIYSKDDVIRLIQGTDDLI